MVKPASQAGAASRLASALLALGLAGCASAPPPTDATTSNLPDPELVEIPRLERRKAMATPISPAPPAVPLPAPPGVAIVLSARQPAYEAVAIELGQRLDNAAIYDLSDRSMTPETAFRQIADSDTGAIVAIGLSAARSAVALATIPVVFCQVFNYQDPGLVTDSSRGVAALAPLDAHLDAWKRANPGLRRVGAIIGEGHDDLVEEAHIAADRHGIELTVVVVGSDQEAQYQFRRIVNDIDGFWLFPDSRVLSSRSLRGILAQARRSKVEVAVSNDALLTLGATISISSVPADIASTVIEVIRRIEAGQLPGLPDITPLSAIQVVTR